MKTDLALRKSNEFDKYHTPALDLEKYRKFKNIRNQSLSLEKTINLKNNELIVPKQYSMAPSSN